MFGQYYCYFQSLIYFFLFFFIFKHLWQMFVLSLIFLNFFHYLSIKVNFECCQGKMFIAIYSKNIYQAFTIQLEPRVFSPHLGKYTKYAYHRCLKLIYVSVVIFESYTFLSLQLYLFTKFKCIALH